MEPTCVHYRNFFRIHPSALLTINTQIALASAFLCFILPETPCRTCGSEAVRFRFYYKAYSAQIQSKTELLNCTIFIFVYIILSAFRL